MMRKFGISVVVALAVLSLLIWVVSRGRQSSAPPPDASVGAPESGAREGNGGRVDVRDDEADSTPSTLNGTAVGPSKPPELTADVRSCRVSGQILDETREPIAGALVVLLRDEDLCRAEREGEESARGRPDLLKVQIFSRARDALLRAAPQSRSDTSGHYELVDVAPGAYTVNVRESAHLPHVEHLIFEPAEDCVHDFTLIRGAVIAGIVVGADNNPVSNAVVEVEPSRVAAARGAARRLIAARDLRAGTVEERTAVPAGEDGHFSVAGCEEVAYYVRVRAPGFVAAEIPDVAPGNESLTVRLNRGGSLTGTIVAKEPERISVCAVSDYELESYLLDPAAASATASPTMPGGDGRFEIASLETGSYAVVARASGLQPFVSALVNVTAESTTDVGTLQMNEDRPIRGRVLDDAGRPLPGARVRAVAAGEGRRSWRTIALPAPSFAETVSSDDGSFAISSLPDDIYDIEVWESSHLPGFAGEVETGAEGLEFRLDEGVVVCGSVEDEDGKPIAGAEIGSLPMQRSVSDSRGRFRLAGIPRPDPESTDSPYPIPLTASASGFRTHRGAAFIDPSGVTLEVEVVLQRELELAGTVLTPEGEPAPGAMVRLVVLGMAEQPPGARAPVRANEHGRFLLTVEGWNAGGVREPELVATHPEWGDGTSGPIGPEHLENLESLRSVEVRLTRGTEIRGRVANAEGLAVRGATLSISYRPVFTRATTRARAAGVLDTISSAASDIDGNFRFEKVAPGEYLLEVAHVGFAEQSVEITVGGEDSLVLDFALEAGGVLSGILWDASGRPLEGIEVLAANLETSPMESRRDLEFYYEITPGLRRTKSSADGSFELSRLPNRDLTVIARHDDYALAYREQVRPGSELIELTLVPHALLHVTVIDDELNEPVKDYDLRVRVASTSETTHYELPGSELWGSGGRGERRVHDGEGQTWIRRLPPGRYEVSVDASGYEPWAAPVSIDPGESHELVVRLVRGATLTVHVIAREHEEPISGAMVELVRLDRSGRVDRSRETRSAFWREASSDDGIAVVAGVPRGNYLVQVAHPFFLPTSTSSIAIEGDTEAPAIVLDPAAVVEVGLTGLSAASAAGMEIELELVGAPRSLAREAVESSPRIIAPGRFRFESVAPGEYLVRVELGDRNESDDDRWLRFGTFRLDVGENRPIEIDLTAKR